MNFLSHRNFLIYILFLQLDLLRVVHGFVDIRNIGNFIKDGTTQVYYKVKNFASCPFTECCNDDYVIEDWQALQEDLKENLFGQNLAIKLLTKALKSHFNKLNRKKPLVISLHGDVGTGKTFTSEIIAKHMFKEGSNSAFVHRFVAADFPYKHESHLPEYQIFVIENVKAALASCPRSLFIFDEVDKYQPGIFDLLTSYIDHHRILNGIHFDQAIYVFISNLPLPHISEDLKSLYKAGKVREQLDNSYFEDLLKKKAFDLKGGLKSAAIIEGNLIDHYIPYLPLEKSHVKECIRGFFAQYNRDPSEHGISKIFDENVVLDEDGIFAESGCKRIEKKVDLEVF